MKASLAALLSLISISIIGCNAMSEPYKVSNLWNGIAGGAPSANSIVLLDCRTRPFSGQSIYYSIQADLPPTPVFSNVSEDTYIVSNARLAMSESLVTPSGPTTQLLIDELVTLNIHAYKFASTPPLNEALILFEVIATPTFMAAAQGIPKYGPLFLDFVSGDIIMPLTELKGSPGLKYTGTKDLPALKTNNQLECRTQVRFGTNAI